MIRTKRVYEPPEKADGLRVLVDCLWPRGLKKDQARIDAWLKGLAPSECLRKWFGHEPVKWEEFRRRYRLELENRADELGQIRRWELENEAVTLLFAAKDPQRNNAVVLGEALAEMGQLAKAED